MRARATGLLDALCEGAFVRAPDGRRLFFPWGAAGRGYAVPDEARYRRLRREMRRLVGIGLAGVPIVAMLGRELLGLASVAAIGVLLAALGALRVASLARGLAPSRERITRAESNARVARALRRVGGTTDAPGDERL
jgi:hypothetical protein